MTEQELIKGYQEEIAYQKHMLENLQRWFNLLFVVASLGIVLIYFFHRTNILLLILGSILTLFGILGMLLFGYGRYRGAKNLSKVIDNLEKRVYPL